MHILKHIASILAGFMDPMQQQGTHPPHGYKRIPHAQNS